MNEIAPKGQVFVCGACGRRSKDLYGDQAIDCTWDESCMLNAILCHENSLVFTNDGNLIIAEAVKND